MNLNPRIKLSKPLCNFTDDISSILGSRRVIEKHRSMSTSVVLEKQITTLYLELACLDICRLYLMHVFVCTVLLQVSKVMNY